MPEFPSTAENVGALSGAQLAIALQNEAGPANLGNAYWRGWGRPALESTAQKDACAVGNRYNGW